MKRIGLIVNPIAGMGGSVGLKGTDNTAAEAFRRGAVPRAENRAKAALAELLPIKRELFIYTCPGNMGGNIAEELGFQTVVKPDAPDSAVKKAASMNAGTIPEAFLETSADDTKSLAKWLLTNEVDLILFAGGDGTARDIYQAIELSVCCVGIPAGVKIHSPVYARNPKAAGQLALRWLTGKISAELEEEVLDIDEEQYRRERINTRLYGYLKIPKERALTQNRKAPTPLTDAASIVSIAHEVIRQMEPDTFYIIGAGTTTRGVMEILGLKNTLIGIDLVYNKELAASDLGGSELLSLIKGKKNKLIVSITGGQGYLFGRGNQQLTPDVIREVGKENIIILSTKTKLAALSGQPLLVDTYDEELNLDLCGYYRVIVGCGETIACKVTDK